MNEIFQTVNEKYEIAEVAKGLGITLHRVGRSLRADSIAGNGAGKDAFAVYETTNTWYDFMLGKGGDITDLVAIVKYKGDKYRALCELMPECQQSRDFRREISKRDEFAQFVKKLSGELLHPTKEINTKALEYLHSRKITDETIEKLQIGLDYGYALQIRLRFPYWNQSGDRILYFSTRTFPHGQGDGEPKYMKASLQAYPFLKNSPLGLNTVKSDKDFCIITEGMFDWLHCYQQGFAALSPNGCDFGKLWPEVLEVIKQHFRSVVLMFDNDTAGTEATVKAAEVLMKEQISFRVAQIINVKDLAEFCENGGEISDLVNRSRDGLKWYIDYLRPPKDFDLLTVDERNEAIRKCRKFIKTVSTYTKSSDVQEVLLRLRGYFPSDWVKALCKDAQRGLTEDEACEKVLESHKLMFNSRVGFYEFTSKKIWERQDDNTIMSYIKKAYGIYATGSKISTTLKLLRAHEQVNSEIPIKSMNKKCCVSFYNGTLHIDMKTGETQFLPHSPNDYVTVRLPYFYMSEAKCPTWEKFIDDVTSGNKAYQAVLQEFSGYVLSPDCRYQKALMLKGGGSNGKSVFTNMIKAIFGDTKGECNGYVSYAEPSKFGRDFRLMGFRESWLNISSDTENNMVGGEGVFKKLVVGEVVEDSYKYKDPFPFQPRTKIMMCCNFFPTVSDTSEGFMRRWLVIPFSEHFVDENKVKEGDKPINSGLEFALHKEISGIFNWVLEGLKRLIRQNRFTELEDQSEFINEFAKANNPLYCFVEECFKKLKSKGHRHEIYTLYRGWAEESGVQPLAANRFYSNLKTVLQIYGIRVSERGRIWMLDGKLDIEDDDEILAEISKEEQDKRDEWVADLVRDLLKLIHDYLSDPSSNQGGHYDIVEGIIEEHLKRWIA
ncbi:MAG: toprim domain-containing protein [Synergistaceae bacterium]|nr:toprim domain-containing protein [Synergistaceae bacterium]